MNYQLPSDTALQDFFARCRASVEAELERLLPAAEVAPEIIHEAMRWSVFAGGKRLRPALVVAAGEACGAQERQLLRTACAFEMVHTYSLIHDDLPAMDDDDLRRGRPTCHIKYGQANAILAGDALQTLAFQTIAEDETLPAEIRARLVAELARASGTPFGMVAGQVYDLAAEGRARVAGDELERIHRHKTGALITAAVRCGAIIGGAAADELNALTNYAAALGLLFQITDDLLDVTATAEALGKTPGKDERARKVTYPALYGLEAARQRAREEHDQACAALACVSRDVSLLRGLARFTLERRK
jgi:geranylgeranyl pyrophosphate synthase